jgi:pimeloyl-ACP methyl ester carboxylesterase
LLLMALALPASAVTSPPTIRETVSVEIAGYQEDVDIYRPAAGPSEGFAIIAHGFARSRIRHRNLGRALAEAGVIAVIPDLPNVVDLWGNGDAIVELAQKLASGTVGGRAVDPSRLVLIGTSAGGLATVLAAAKLPGLAGWIGLDPVDRTGSGRAAAAQVAAPAVVLLGGASSCNLLSSGRDIAGALPHLLRRTALKDATHCDFEDPTTNFCRVLCGGSSTQMQMRVRDETVQATLDLLRIAAMPPLAAPSAGDEPTLPAPPAAIDTSPTGGRDPEP